MKNLNIDNIPDDLYRRLSQLARTNNRTLRSQIIDMLAKAVVSEERSIKQADILKSIQSRRFKSQANTSTTLDFLREDRRR